MASASRVASGVTKGLPSRSPPIQEPKLTSWGRSASAGLGVVLGCQSAGDLGVEHGQRVEDGGLVVVERHADLVAHGGAGVADVVGLPERGDLGDDILLQRFELGIGDGDAVELLQQVGDAAALEHDDAARDLGRVRGEDGRDADAGEQLAWPASAEMPARRSWRSAPRREPRCGSASGSSCAGEAAALAVVGLGEIDELEVEAEGAGELVGGGLR